MQILKDEVKQNIISAAIQEFAEVGYQKASLRKIAGSANITVGNIYAYFKNKENLLDSILHPVINELNELIANLSKGQMINSVSLESVANEITDIFLRNKQQFLILMVKPHGTKYENTKQQIIELVSKRMNDEYLPCLPLSAQDDILAITLGSALIEGLLHIFVCAYQDESRVRKLVITFMYMLFSDIQTTPLN